MLCPTARLIHHHYGQAIVTRHTFLTPVGFKHLLPSPRRIPGLRFHPVRPRVSAVPCRKNRAQGCSTTGTDHTEFNTKSYTVHQNSSKSSPSLNLYEPFLSTILKPWDVSPLTARGGTSEGSQIGMLIGAGTRCFLFGRGWPIYLNGIPRARVSPIYS